MAHIIDEITAFLPVYNEEQNIGSVVRKVRDVLEKTADKWEVLIIDDGSSDQTVASVMEPIKSDERIRLISHKENRGYGAALKSGFYNAKYNWISFIDSDGQFDYSEIYGFIEKQKETNADLVIGYYKKRQVSYFKKLTSKIWELSVLILFGLRVRDIDCGFKLIRKDVIDSIPKLESERGAFISSELLIKARKKGFKIVEIPVTHYPRTKGKGTGRNLNVIIKSFMDLLRLWKKLR
jgi:glycosyltransferase involved in cell wall biosynthesis